MSSSSLPCSEQDHLESVAAPSSDVIDGDDEEEEFYETEPLPILGRCRALYAFEGNKRFSQRIDILILIYFVLLKFDLVIISHVCHVLYVKKLFLYIYCLVHPLSSIPGYATVVPNKHTVFCEEVGSIKFEFIKIYFLTRVASVARNCDSCSLFAIVHKNLSTA
jgi:hypothetical protein